MEQRIGDRRKQPTNPFRWSSLFYGRRKGHRRAGDPRGYLDQYNPRLLFPVLFIMLLCSFDAGATLLHINKNVATEANPLMAYLIEISPMKFFMIKYFATFLGVLILMTHHWLPRVRSALWGIVVCYVIIGLFHAFIINNRW